MQAVLAAQEIVVTSDLGRVTTKNIRKHRHFVLIVVTSDLGRVTTNIFLSYFLDS